jgi:hypothetical protein
MGRRKAESTATEESSELFRRHFENRFTPLLERPECDSEAAAKLSCSDSQSDSDWAGFSDGDDVTVNDGDTSGIAAFPPPS